LPTFLEIFKIKKEIRKAKKES
jgi:hypothetical protein